MADAQHFSNLRNIYYVVHEGPGEMIFQTFFRLSHFLGPFSDKHTSRDKFIPRF